MILIILVDCNHFCEARIIRYCGPDFQGKKERKNHDFDDAISRKSDQFPGNQINFLENHPREFLRILVMILQ